MSKDNPAGAKQINPSGRDPVKYIVNERSLIGHTILEAGAEVMYDGLPSENLTPTCDVGKARAAEYAATNAERVKRMIADTPASPTAGAIDPQMFAAAVAKAVAEANAEFMTRMESAIAALQPVAQGEGEAAEAAKAAVADLAVAAGKTKAKPATGTLA